MPCSPMIAASRVLELPFYLRRGGYVTVGCCTSRPASVTVPPNCHVDGLGRDALPADHGDSAAAIRDGGRADCSGRTVCLRVLGQLSHYLPCRRRADQALARCHARAGAAGVPVG